MLKILFKIRVKRTLNIFIIFMMLIILYDNIHFLFRFFLYIKKYQIIIISYIFSFFLKIHKFILFLYKKDIEVYFHFFYYYS